MGESERERDRKIQREPGEIEEEGDFRSSSNINILF